ncbi:ABC transporter substrate-binding protein, partial [Pseudomonas aeruginosa]
FMTAFVALNTQHPPLDDPKVRQAINLAFDRTSYLQAVFEGSASAATGIYPPNTWSYARDIPAYPHAPEQARKLLAGKQLPELNIWTRPSGSLLNPNPS